MEWIKKNTSFVALAFAIIAIALAGRALKTPVVDQFGARVATSGGVQLTDNNAWTGTNSFSATSTFATTTHNGPILFGADGTIDVGSPSAYAANIYGETLWVRELATTTQIYVNDGSLAIPAIGFANATTTGLHLATGGKIAFGKDATLLGVWDLTSLIVTTSLQVNQTSTFSGSIVMNGEEYRSITTVSSSEYAVPTGVWGLNDESMVDFTTSTLPLAADFPNREICFTNSSANGSHVLRIAPTSPDTVVGSAFKNLTQNTGRCVISDGVSDWISFEQ